MAAGDCWLWYPFSIPCSLLWWGGGARRWKLRPYDLCSRLNKYYLVFSSLFNPLLFIYPNGQLIFTRFATILYHSAVPGVPSSPSLTLSQYFDYTANFLGWWRSRPFSFNKIDRVILLNKQEISTRQPLPSGHCPFVWMGPWINFSDLKKNISLYLTGSLLLFLRAWSLLRVAAFCWLTWEVILELLDERRVSSSSSMTAWLFSSSRRVPLCCCSSSRRFSLRRLLSVAKFSKGRWVHAIGIDRLRAWT